MNRLIFLMIFIISLSGCEWFGNKSNVSESDQRQQKQSEVLLNRATSAVGMPGIQNFRERKLLKTILEMRDRANLSTYTYLWSEVTGKKIPLCNSIGYGIPFATQYTNPAKVVEGGNANGGYWGVTMPQADPNGLFYPTSADSTWVVCKDPESNEVQPVYVEPKIIVSQFPLPALDKWFNVIKSPENRLPTLEK